MFKNYLEVFEELYIFFVLSLWYDKDVNKEIGEFKKVYKYGVFFFEFFKSYL